MEQQSQPCVTISTISRTGYGPQGDVTLPPLESTLDDLPDLSQGVTFLVGLSVWTWVSALTLVLRPIWVGFLDFNGRSSFTCVPCPTPFLQGWNLYPALPYFKTILDFST